MQIRGFHLINRRYFSSKPQFQIQAVYSQIGVWKIETTVLGKASLAIQGLVSSLLTLLVAVEVQLSWHASGPMDTRYSADIYKHLEKHDELLMDTYRSMLHDVQRLLVEEKMLMCKFYELMIASGQSKQNDDKKDCLDTGENGNCTGLVLKDDGEQH